MKLLLDFLPLILFFATFRYADGNKEAAAAFASEHFGFLVSGGQVGLAEAPVLLSTLVVIVATLLQVLYLKVRRQKVDLMLWISLVMVVVLGGLTVWLHSDTFIKWKPTGLYAAFALVLGLSPWLAGKNLIRAMIGDQLPLPDAVWAVLNRAWVLFFAAMAVLNIVVAYSVDTATWVNFKVFGITALMAVFMVGQGFYIHRHLPPEDDAGAPKS